MIGLMITVSAPVGLVLVGLALIRRVPRNPRGVLRAAVGVSALLVLTGAALALTEGGAMASSGAAAGPGTQSGLGFIGASLSTGLACLGAGLAVSGVGAAALGLVGEKPQMLGTTLIYLGLAEGIAIYGVIVSLLIMGKM
ncbi:ATP synthase subunit C [Thermanaerovibrio acidaminovorans]|uniref:ATP synthase subunit C n=1 Tax=Thermanaerovibrio acidaminovorans TaxID=81462 RepID=UPI0024907002|nr:ATP synthase subunit C [Thermanaerovibrio acidaminovorans]